MIQPKFSLNVARLRVLEECKKCGFKDGSALVRTSIDFLSAQSEQQRLQESAVLYAEIYEQDEDIREWNEEAVTAWPK
ncbi:MAG: hypothetical protein WC824_15725 [Bacteroidota bacterium]|jgi:hypothetical protein